MNLSRLFNLGLALVFVLTISGCMHRGGKVHAGKGKSHAASTYNIPANNQQLEQNSLSLLQG